MGWFGKKVTLAVPGPDGALRKVRVPERQWDQWVAAKRVQRIDCRVRILDVIEGERATSWTVGEHVTREVYERLKDEHGDLHAVIHFADGVRTTTVLDKSSWEKLRQDQFSTPDKVQAEDDFAYNYRKLLESDREIQGVAALTLHSMWMSFNAQYPGERDFRDADPQQLIADSFRCS
jgi:hypothetical protein